MSREQHALPQEEAQAVRGILVGLSLALPLWGMVAATIIVRLT